MTEYPSLLPISSCVSSLSPMSLLCVVFVTPQSDASTVHFLSARLNQEKVASSALIKVPQPVSP